MFSINGAVQDSINNGFFTVTYCQGLNFYRAGLK